jgi:transposase
MTMWPRSGRAIPAATAQVARAAFPKGCLAIRIRDALGELFDDAQFAGLFATRGRPAVSPARLALVSVLQFAEGLSDRQAADAVRARIDWKYALGLELADTGFDASVLSEFRVWLVDGGAAQRLLERMLERLRAQGLLVRGGRQRTDATCVVAAVRELNRLELVTETMRAAPEALAAAAPEWLVALAPADWYQRYGQRASDYRLPQHQTARAALAVTVGTDGFALLEAVYAADTPGWLRQVPAVGDPAGGLDPAVGPRRAGAALARQGRAATRCLGHRQPVRHRRPLRDQARDGLARLQGPPAPRPASLTGPT